MGLFGKNSAPTTKPKKLKKHGQIQTINPTPFRIEKNFPLCYLRQGKVL